MQLYKIMSVFEDFNPCAELGVIMPLNFLERQGRLIHRPFTMHRARLRDVAWADLLILQRLFRPEDMALLAAARELGKPVLYDIDDNLLEVPAAFGPAVRHYTLPQNKRAIQLFLKSADMVKAGTPALAEALRPYTAREPVVLPLLNPRELYAPVRRSEDAVFRFVYAATPHNYLEFERIAGRAMERVMQRYGEAVHFHFFGGNFIDTLNKAKNAAFTPPMPMKAFMEAFTSTPADAGLACFEDTFFNRCKTNTKFREYGARGLAGVYSDIPIYNHCVRHGETGLLTPNDEQSWFEAMCFLVENREKAKRMGDAARTFTEKTYTVEASAKAWMKDILLPLLMPGWEGKRAAPSRNSAPVNP